MKNKLTQIIAIANQVKKSYTVVNLATAMQLVIKRHLLLMHPQGNASTGFE